MLQQTITNKRKSQKINSRQKEEPIGNYTTEKYSNRNKKENG